MTNQLAVTLSTATTTDIVTTRTAAGTATEPETNISNKGSSAEELSITYTPNTSNAMVKYKEKFNQYLAQGISFNKINISCEYDLQIRVVALLRILLYCRYPVVTIFQRLASCIIWMLTTTIDTSPMHSGTSKGALTS